MSKLNVSVQKLEWEQTDGRTEAIALIPGTNAVGNNWLLKMTLQVYIRLKCPQITSEVGKVCAQIVSDYNSTGTTEICIESTKLYRKN